MEHQDIDGFIQEIEKKYSSNKTLPGNEFQEQLYILSQEFDTLGLPSINLEQSVSEVLQAIVNNAFLLIQSHRKTLSHITNMNITDKSKDIETQDLQKNVLNQKRKLKTVEDEKLKMERKLAKVNSECEELNKKISIRNKETDKLKQFFKSKQNQLIHRINNLEQENHHLREICGKDFDKYFSKEDKFLKILKTYKQNEEVYKGALQKLEENNTEIMNEILNLKRELTLAYLKK